jgi:hypothetical protein
MSMYGFIIGKVQGQQAALEGFPYHSWARRVKEREGFTVCS